MIGVFVVDEKVISTAFFVKSFRSDHVVDLGSEKLYILIRVL